MGNHRGYRLTRTRTSLTVSAISAALAMVLLIPGSGHAEPELTLGKAQQRYDDINHQAELATEEYNGIQEQLRQVRERLRQVQDRVARQQDSLAQLRNSLGKLARIQYQTGAIDGTVRLLLAEDPVAFLEQASLLDQLSDHQAKVLNQARSARQEMAQAKAEANQQTAQLESLHREVEKRKAEIEERLREAQRLLNSLRPADRVRVIEGPAPSRSSASDRATCQKAIARATGRAKAAITFACAQLGKPYRWGATGLASYDCSGLVLKAWAAAGIQLPRTSRAMYAAGRKIPLDQIIPGDSIFSYSPISHVSIYIGEDFVVTAPRAGLNVRISPMKYFKVVGATRPGG